MAAILIGVILGPLLETYFLRALKMSDGDIMVLFSSNLGNVLWFGLVETFLRAPLKIICWAAVCRYRLTMKPFDQNFWDYHAFAGSFFPKSQLQTCSSNKTHGEPAMARRSN